MLIPNLQTERLTLRAPKSDDFPAIAAFYSSERSQYVGGPKRPDEAWRMLGLEIGHWSLRGYGRWAVEEKATGTFCGLVGLWNPEGWPEPEIGWDLMNGLEGKGFATEAALAARSFAYETLGWTTAISLIAPDNVKSAGLARRIGAQHERDFHHHLFGPMQIWRHLSADSVHKGAA
jgi:ribosomal-protein-alanine N-acetyltransferase